MRFYLGTDEPHWLGRVDVPLFVSHRRLRDRRSLPRASAPWALDSGAFSELTQHAEWQTTEDEYVQAVARYAVEIGEMDFAAPMDWMCEPHMLERTGLSVGEHQRRTTRNFLSLRERAPELPWIPVLQGWTLEDYQCHVYLYYAEGVILDEERLVGLGSVCRRQNTGEIGRIVRYLHSRDISIHGFGVKLNGLRRYGHFMDSADSMAWSYRARHAPPLAGCTHTRCNHCVKFALLWRQGALRTQTAMELSV